MSESLDLPLACITRICKHALPPGAQISKEVKQAMGKAAALFILYLTNTANEMCRQSGRTLVSADDVLAGVEEIEFDMFLQPLQKYLEQFRVEMKKKREASGSGKKRSRAEAEQPQQQQQHAQGDTSTAEGGADAREEGEGEGERAEKKQRADTSTTAASGNASSSAGSGGKQDSSHAQDE